MQKSNPFGKTHWSQSLVILGIILFAIAIALWQMVPPNVIPATAPLTEFSADRIKNIFRYHNHLQFYTFEWPQ